LRNFFFPCLCVSRVWRSTMSFKTVLFCASSLSLFFLEQSMTQHRFSPNVPFHLKGKGIKTCWCLNQSSIYDLFNQVFNCNFDFKNQFNRRLWTSSYFSIWSLVSDLCNLTLNWSTNFQFLQFSPWFDQFQALYLRVFSSLVHGFRFLQLSP
jgi:hypothetical protein